MKTKILATLLGLSVLLNVAGVVFFVCFLKLQGSYRAVRKERNAMARNLTAVRVANVATDALNSDRVVKRTFQSLADGNEDTYALLPPEPGSSAHKTLIVYLHGMGSNYLEPFIYPTNQPVASAISAKYGNTILLSCNYRKEANWGTDSALGDITQNVREILQEFPIDHIVLMGTSMGGCTSLLYATVAPADIKAKIEGVVCVEGAGSLQHLCERTANQAVKLAIGAAMGGAYAQVPAAYARKSFLPNINELPKSVSVSVVSAVHDTVVPPELQQEVVDALNGRQQRVKLFTVDGGHAAPPAPTYIQALDFVLSSS